MSDTPERLPKGVYVRRRVVVVLGLFAIIGIIVALVAGPDRVAGWLGEPDDEAAAQHSQGEGSAEAAPEPAPEATPGPCDTARLGVAAVADRPSYAADEFPQLSLRVTNHNEVACDADLGSATMVFVITSGSEVYWDSRHCQLDGEELLVRLQPGQTLETTPLEWKRERSSPDTCGDESRPQVPGGGVSYHLAVEVAGVESASTHQFLLY